MSRKIAIYVEGQTEQILLNHLIKTWWGYAGMSIQNLKLWADANTHKVPDFMPANEQSPETIFLIIDVQGVGSLISALAERANSQHQSGFELIGLRDLEAEDYSKKRYSSIQDAIAAIREATRKALEVKRCQNPEKIDLFFAVMEIESWLLAFESAIAKWGRMTEQDVQQMLAGQSLEAIASPHLIVERIADAAGRIHPKSYDAVTSLVSSILREQIERVYTSSQIPSFTQFWDRFVGLSAEAATS